MADNVAVTPGAGADIATDNVGGVHYQRVKVAWGADGVANDADTNSPVPVQVLSGGGGDASAANQTALNTLVGPVNETAPASDTASSGLNGRLQRIAQRLTALLPASLGQKAKAASLAVTLASDQDALGLAAGEAHVGQVGGEMPTPVAQSFTRPANTTAYAAGDIVSNDATTTVLMAFAGMARVAGGGGYIVAARLWTNKKSWTPRFRVHLFNASNPTVSGDNLPHRGAYADIGKRAAVPFDLAAMSTPTDATNSDYSGASDGSLRVPFVCAAGSTTLYVLLELLDAPTPDSGQSFTLVLTPDQN